MTIKNIKWLFLTAFSVLVILMVFPFAKLLLTDAKVVEPFLFDIYFAKVAANEAEFDVLTEYMNEKGWQKIDQLGGQIIFEKAGLKKYISTTQVKTILLDDRLNLD